MQYYKQLFICKMFCQNIRLFFSQKNKLKLNFNIQSFQLPQLYIDEKENSHAPQVACNTQIS